MKAIEKMKVKGKGREKIKPRCTNKASHVPDDEVPADKKKEYREYHIKIRK